MIVGTVDIMVSGKAIPTFGKVHFEGVMRDQASDSQAAHKLTKSSQ